MRAETWPVRKRSRATELPLSARPVIAGGRVDDVLLVVDGRVDELGLARGCGVVELGGLRWCSSSRGALALPRGIPKLEVSQDPLYDIVLPRRGDRRDDAHRFSARTENLRILQVNLGD